MEQGEFIGAEELIRRERRVRNKVLMRIIVRQILEAGSDYPTFSLEVTSSMLVSELQQQLERLSSLSASAQRLTCYCHGIRVLLSHSWPLSFYQLEDGSNVFLADIGLVDDRSPSREEPGVEELETDYLYKVVRECKRGSLSGLKRWLTEYCMRAVLREEDEQLIDKLGPGGWGCVHYACYSGSTEILAYLLDLGADVNKESHDGWTPLQLAVSRGHHDCTPHTGVSSLLSSPTIEVNHMTAFRGSALHISSLKGFSDITELLLKANASMTQMDYKGRIPLQLASSQEIIEMIPKFMGVQTLRKYSKNEIPIPEEVPEVPPPFCGELSLFSPCCDSDPSTYIVLDILEACLELFPSRDSFMDREIPLETISLIDISRSFTRKLTENKSFLVVLHRLGRVKLYSRYIEVVMEWERQINYAVQLHRTKQDSIMRLRDSIRLESSFKDPEAPPSPRLPPPPQPFSLTELPTLGLDSFEVLQEIGAGSFGCVYRAKRKENGEIVALKALNKKMLVRNRQLKYAVGECKILRQLKSQFIVRMFDAFQTPNSLYMVLEYCPGRDLSILLEQKGRFSADEARFYMAEVILALEYLHERNIMYRDLKPENVLLDEFGHVKLADFGLAKENVTESRQSKSFCGSPAYLSPEVLDKQGAGKSADIYGIGAVLYELLTGMPPFYDDDLKVLYENIRKGALNFPRYVNNTCKELIKVLLNKVPRNRPKLPDVKNHPFFRKINWEQLARKQVTPPVRPRHASESMKPYRVRLIDKDYSGEMSLEECMLDLDK